MNVECYYPVGIPLGAVLGFKFNLESKGIWSGMLAGTAMQTAILLWVTFRTDWFERSGGNSRLNKWEEMIESVSEEGGEKEAALMGSYYYPP